MNNGTNDFLTFDQSISHNIAWIKKLADEYDISQGMAANAALMTMLMMDHHKFSLLLAHHEALLTEIHNVLCQSSSLETPTKAQ